MFWYFISVYLISRKLHGHLGIRNFSSRVEEIFFNTRTEISYFRAAMYQCILYTLFATISFSCWHRTNTAKPQDLLKKIAYEEGTACHANRGTYV